MRIWLAAMALGLAFALPAKQVNQVYGQAMPNEVIAVPLAAAVAEPDHYTDRPRVFSGTVKEVCQKQGCWMVIVDGDVYARVLTDHKFKIPASAYGPSLVYGTLRLAQIDAKTAAHYAKDAGKPAPTDNKPQQEWRIDATSVAVGE